MARALDIIKTIGRIIWLCTGIGLLVLVIKRWMWLHSAADPQPIKPGDVIYHPEPDTAGKSEADKAEALRQKLRGKP